MTARSLMIRAAVDRMPETFLATDVFAELPSVNRQAISNVLTSMNKQGLIAYDGNEIVTVEIPAPGCKDGVYRAKHPVRRFTQPKQPLISLPPVGTAAHAALTATMPRNAATSATRRAVSWEDGSKALALVFAAWPSPEPNGDETDE